MPTLNQVAFLPAAVTSVMADDVGTALIVQDGASSDGTLEKLATLSATLPGIHTASEPDSGPAEALNRAFRRALGSGAAIIGWLNSDDLYAAGALPQVLAHFRRHPEHVAVYGEGEHIDAEGRRIGRYPTLPPTAALSRWQGGCPICQPTMFLRREAVEALLPLDTRLRTAFDFELWLRLFKAFPGQIGFIPRVLAQSRLHASGITLRLREQVALEGMTVVHRHLGLVAPHWLMTHVAEAFAPCPFETPFEAVQRRLLELTRQTEDWIGAADADFLRQQMRQSLAWRLAQAGVGSNLQTDGWAGPRLELRMHQRDATRAPVQSLLLHGHHAWPRHGRLRLKLTAWIDGLPVAGTTAWWRQRFVLEIPVPTVPAGRPICVEVRSDGSFVPAEALKGSTDTRHLAFRLEQLVLLPA